MSREWPELGEGVRFVDRVHLRRVAGRTLLQLDRRLNLTSSSSLEHSVIVDAAGPVLVAGATVNGDSGFTLTSSGVTDGAFYWRPSWGTTTSGRTGLLRGAHAGGLQVVESHAWAGVLEAYFPGDEWTFRTPGSALDAAGNAADLSKAFTFGAPVAGGLVLRSVNGQTGKGWWWTPTSGVQPLLVWPDEPKRYIRYVATDQTDLVWIEVTEDASGIAHPRFMTAPYALNQQAVTAATRPLRTFPVNATVYASARLAVGCGHAAIAYSDLDTATNDLRLVRLKDGVSWLFAGATEPKLAWTSAFGFDCQHLYAFLNHAAPEYGAVAQIEDVVRIPLAQLGPGEPPDL